MGRMGFGDAQNSLHSWAIDEAYSREIIKRGLELGVNFFDTAITNQGGTSAQYLSRAIRDFAKWDEVVVAAISYPAPTKKPRQTSAARSISDGCWTTAFRT